MYQLNKQGAISHWLACGTITSPIDQLPQLIPSEGDAFGENQRWILNYWAYDPRSIRIKQNLFAYENPFTWQPELDPELNSRAFGGQNWRYVVTEEDEAIDFSRFNFTPSIMRAWLFTQIHVAEDCTISAELLTIGPAQIWVNDILQSQFDETFSYVRTLYIPARLSLQAGINNIYVHGMTFGWREARLALGLRLKTEQAVQISIPLGEVDQVQWLNAEQSLNLLQIKQFAFPQISGSITLDPDADLPVEVDVQVEIPLDGSPWAKLGNLDIPSERRRVTLSLGESAELPLTPAIAQAMTSLPGETSARLTLRPIDGTPIALERKIWLSQNTFSHEPYGTYESRRKEALEHLAGMSSSIFATISAIENGTAKEISSDAVAIACEFLEKRFDCADFYALSLLALLYWHEDKLKADDKARIENAFLHFKFWIDEPGLDAMCYFTENHQILFHVTAYLTGQRWSNVVFTNSNWTGDEQKQRAEDRIRNWILRRLKGGFSEWDSNAYMAMDMFAMLSLVEFAENESLREMAETLLHKSFFMLAMQSFRGTHASTHGRCYVDGLKSARLENTSSLQRIAWGMGIFNGETRATGMLTLAKRYNVPEILQAIGANTSDTTTTFARSTASFRLHYDMRDDRWDVRTITRRTSDTMLAAAIDYFPSERGVQEHLWQATLSPEAVVFTNYPGNSQEHGYARPNFWSGSALLPRVAMHNRCVICLYQFKHNIGLGFSHAYFPTYAFDEWLLDGQWAFARYQSGYIALWGDGELILTKQGKHSYQELRSSGNSQVWIAFVGSRDQDGDFLEFRAKVQQQALEADGTNIKWTTLDGEHLQFAWESPLMVNDTAINWDDFPHYRNQYTDTSLSDDIMSIHYEDKTMKLDLANGRVLQTQ